jgi:hypothetical protein
LFLVFIFEKAFNKMEAISMIDGKRKFYRMVSGTDSKSDSISEGLLVVAVLLLLFCFFVLPAGAKDMKPLTLLYFGCQDGYLKPCG